MNSSLLRLFLSFATVAVVQSSTCAQLISPQIGWQADLVNELSHDVSGTVTILDKDTVRVDDFTYNGGGGAVYFYLGTIETDAAFVAGLRLEPLLSGSVFDGTQDPLVVDLPLGETLEGFHAFSVWCEAREANFGSGTFQPVIVPEPASLILITIGSLFLTIRRRR